MPEVAFGPDHILQIWATPDGGTAIDVFHPTGCTEGHPIDDGPGCLVLDEVVERHEEIVRGFGLGTHRVEAWGHGPYWAGATRMDGDGGLRYVGSYDW